MNPTILAAIGIAAALGSIAAQLVYLRATLYNLHSTATCALVAAAVQCTIAVTITACLCLP
jgi:hypothetical protein